MREILVLLVALAAIVCLRPTDTQNREARRGIRGTCRRVGGFRVFLR